VAGLTLILLGNLVMFMRWPVRRALRLA